MDLAISVYIARHIALSVYDIIGYSNLWVLFVQLAKFLVAFASGINTIILNVHITIIVKVSNSMDV